MKQRGKKKRGSHWHLPEEKLVSVQSSFDFLRAQTRSNPGQSRQPMANEAVPALERASQSEIRTPPPLRLAAGWTPRCYTSIAEASAHRYSAKL